MTAASNEVLEERMIAMKAQLDDAQTHIRTLDAEVEGLEKKLHEQELAAAAKERRHLMAGITFLGSVIMTLIGLLWAYRGVIFK